MRVSVCMHAWEESVRLRTQALGPTALSPQPVSATWQQWPDSQRGYHHPTREAEVLSTRPGTKHNSINTKARPWSSLVTLYKCTCVGPASGQRWVNLEQSGPRRLRLFTQVEGGTQRSHSSDAWARPGGVELKVAARVSAAPASATTDRSPGGLGPPGASSAPTAQGTQEPSPDPGTDGGASAPWPPLSFRSSPHPAPGKVASACSALGPRGFKKKRMSATRLTFLGQNERAKAQGSQTPK